MIRLTYFFLPLAFTCLLSSTVQAQELPSDWSAIYVANEWQGNCEQAGRGGCRIGNAYYYDSSAGILVSFMSYDQKVITLIVASTVGSCTGGTLTIQGTLAIELAAAGEYCGVAGGKQFRDAARITNSQSQLDIGVFRKAESIELDIALPNGDKLSAKIPMQDFSEKLDASRKPSP